MMISPKVILLIFPILVHVEGNDDEKEAHSRLLRIVKRIGPFVVPNMIDFGLCNFTPFGLPAYFLLETARLSGFDETTKKALRNLETFLDEKLDGRGKKVVGFLFGKNGAIDLAIDNGGMWAAPLATVIIKPMTEYLADPDEFKGKLKSNYDEAKKSIGNFCGFLNKFKHKVKFSKVKAEIEDSEGEKVEENILRVKAADDDEASSSQIGHEDEQLSSKYKKKE